MYAKDGEQLECKEACNRQENILDVSEHDFPNDGDSTSHLHAHAVIPSHFTRRASGFG